MGDGDAHSAILHSAQSSRTLPYGFPIPIIGIVIVISIPLRFLHSLAWAPPAPLYIPA